MVDINNPLDKILSANVLTRQVISNYNTVSDNSASLDTSASYRKLSKGTAEEEVYAESLWDRILFCKYVKDHFSSYDDTVKKDEGRLQYELEYIIGGKPNDKQNLEIVVSELLLLREIDNYLVLLQDEIKKLEAHEVAAVSTAALVPWLEPVVYQATLLYWAYEESVQDLQALFRGEKIPLIKAVSLGIMNEFVLDYEEYLMLLLLKSKKENVVMRTIDMIEMSIRETNANFRMDGCISQAMSSVLFHDGYDKKYVVSGMIRYD
jgi:hypothetical protein